ncbi:MAG: response regulator [Pseudomonadota bacterium]
MADLRSTITRVEGPLPTRIVLIEDDADVSRSLALFLRARGAMVEIYKDGRAFLLNHTEHSGHCILSDYKMPLLDGLELIRRLRALGDTTPAIMITGYYSNTLKARAIEAGYTDVLEKPTPPDILMQRISALT